MITLLRWIRGFFGFFSCYSLLILITSKITYVSLATGFLPLSLKPSNINELNAVYWTAIFISPVTTTILFFFLRKIINDIYYKEHGTSHPKLGSSYWKL